MSDLISREAAIAAATSCPDSHWGPWIADRIRALTAVQPDAATLMRWHDMLLQDFGDDLSSIVRAEMLALIDQPGKEQHT